MTAQQAEARDPGGGRPSEGAEAILKLRAVIATSDFDAYWRFHLRREHERIHGAFYRESLVLAA